MIKLDNISFQDREKVLISNLTLAIQEKDTVVFAGTGESGRSILLKIMAGLLAPTGGNVLYDEQDIYDSSPDATKKLRRQIGFSFQIEGLLSNLTIEENIFLPVKFYNAEEADTYYQSINELLDYFMIRDTWLKRPAELSMQKIKIISFIRAIILKPRILYMDDPFFTLDHFSRKRMMSFLQTLKKSGMTLIIVTNSEEIISNIADRVLLIKNGAIANEFNGNQIADSALTELEKLFTE